MTAPKQYFNPEGNLLQYIVLEWIKITEMIESGSDSTQADRDYLYLTELLGKMLEQNYLIYSEINNEMIQVMIDVEQNESMMIEDEDLVFERRRRVEETYKSDPLINYIVRAFHAIVLRIGI